MLPDAEPEPYFIGEHLVAASSKLVAIDKILADVLPKGDRVLIFSVCTSLAMHDRADRLFSNGHREH
jgi:SWI/SNF-related matrix-associated actin-dependent regulator of chromatin subfamily A member 5